MVVSFNKDAWIISAIKRGYLRPMPDGSILRAKKANADGIVDLDAGYTVVLQQTHKKTGRVYFNMTWMGFRKSVLVNRVIALRFLPNPDRLPQVNHIDGDKANNGVKNLEWASASENERHAHRTGLKSGRGSANSNARLSASDVVEIRTSGADIASLAEKFGVSRSTISNVINRRTWKHV